MNEISQKTLEEIKTKCISPHPKWYFSVRDGLFWSLAVASIGVGSAAVSVMLYLLNESDWQAHEYLNRGLAERAILAVPYFWVMILAAFAGLAYLEFRQTKKGYKFSLSYIVLGSITTSVAVGSLLYFSGYGRDTHDIFVESVPFYPDFVYTNETLWSNPQAGLLTGVIQSASGTDFVLYAKAGKIWIVHATSVGSGTINSAIGSKVKLVGTAEGEATFGARSLLRWDERVVLEKP